MSENWQVNSPGYVQGLQFEIERLQDRIDELEDLVERAQADHLRQTKFHTRVCGDADRYRKALKPLTAEIQRQLEECDGWQQYEFFTPNLDMYLVIQAQKALKGDEDE